MAGFCGCCIFFGYVPVIFTHQDENECKFGTTCMHVVSMAPPRGVTDPRREDPNPGQRKNVFGQCATPVARFLLSRFSPSQANCRPIFGVVRSPKSAKPWSMSSAKLSRTQKHKIKRSGVCNMADWGTRLALWVDRVHWTEDTSAVCDNQDNARSSKGHQATKVPATVHGQKARDI